MAEALTVPMLLLQDDGLLLRANAAGLQALERADLLALHDGHVLPVQADLRGAFIGLLAEASGTGKRCPWRGPGLPDGITVAPAAQGVGPPCRLLMLVMQAEASLDDRCRLFASQFGLTATELAVLRGLSQGLLPHELAAARGVSTATVGRHLARIVRRCGQDPLRAVHSPLPGE